MIERSILETESICCFYVFQATPLSLLKSTQKNAVIIFEEEKNFENLHVRTIFKKSLSYNFASKAQNKDQNLEIIVLAID